ncbi:helix-turn-helix transcriptional regulator [Nodularia sp. UHCC 0506]|uniref:helix-turn-helix transcriptional regulator n=1 Tax=Nodularia sp. UHCC 0506 TaxID=3110243 RepID=UPI002B2109F6|nr:helix-turn-helix transcriptional regulator [Nodularia sp. UHCC 0506]MEA5513924.1 helix-turn-helix transcriptional regulator [Nodularia sp. UHCC 0506]
MKQKPKPRIALLREKAGLTQLELSRLVGVTESTVQNWESGRTGTDHIERIVRFCKALNCQVEDLIEDIHDSLEKPVIEPSSLSEIQSLLGTEEPAIANNSETKVAQEEKVQRQ